MEITFEYCLNLTFKDGYQSYVLIKISV